MLPNGSGEGRTPGLSYLEVASRVRHLARNLSAEQLDQVCEGTGQSDIWSGRHLISLPPEIDERRDLGAIHFGIVQMYKERTGSDFMPWHQRMGLHPALRVKWPPGSYMASWYEKKTGLTQEEVMRRVSASQQAAASLSTTVVGGTAEREATLKVPLLGLFGDLCSTSVREEVVELAQADIQRLARRLREEGRSPRHIRGIVWWQVWRCIVDVLCSAWHRVRGGSSK